MRFSVGRVVKVTYACMVLQNLILNVRKAGVIDEIVKSTAPGRVQNVFGFKSQHHKKKRAQETTGDAREGISDMGFPEFCFAQTDGARSVRVVFSARQSNTYHNDTLLQLIRFRFI